MVTGQDSAVLCASKEEKYFPFRLLKTLYLITKKALTRTIEADKLWRPSMAITGMQTGLIGSP